MTDLFKQYFMAVDIHRCDLSPTNISAFICLRYLSGVLMPDILVFLSLVEASIALCAAYLNKKNRG